MNKISINKIVNVFLTGTIFGVFLCVGYLFLTNSLPFIKAAGVGTGAPDINARYLDGYGTATSSAANKVYVSDANELLPHSVPSGTILMFDTDCPTGYTRISALDGKFLVGGATYSAAVGGADSITLETANIPAHTHTGTTSSNGAHTHTVNSAGTDYGSGGLADGNILSTYTTSSAGSHTHTFTTSSVGSGTAFDNRPAYATIVLCKKD